MQYRVLTPPGYAGSGRSYPVVYVVPGSGTTPDSAVSALELTEYAARNQAILVVAAEVGDGESNFIVDWFDGSKPLDTSFTTQLIPAVDAEYRTLAGGEHRAIFGWSAGGYSAMAIASRHPDLFATAASFSGVTDIVFVGAPWQVTFEAINALFYGEGTAMRRWGNPVTNDANWHAQNPADLAARLRNKPGIYISAGDGTPSSTDELVAAGPYAVQQGPFEHLVWQMTRSYDRKLTAAGVTHTYRPHAGMHRAQHWREDLAIWWPRAIAAITCRDLPVRPRTRHRWAGRRGC